jgi:hypothetical protein
MPRLADRQAGVHRKDGIRLTAPVHASVVRDACREEPGKTDVEGHTSPPVAEGIPSAMLQKSPFFYQRGRLSVKSHQQRAGVASCGEPASRRKDGKDVGSSSFLVSQHVGASSLLILVAKSVFAVTKALTTRIF